MDRRSPQEAGKEAFVPKVEIGYTNYMQTVAHPYIVSDPHTCGGSPRLANTRITVRTVVVAVLLHGLSPEELLQHYPHLSLAAIYDALSYYYDHRTDIDREIAEHEALDPTLPKPAR